MCKSVCDPDAVSYRYGHAESLFVGLCDGDEPSPGQHRLRGRVAPRSVDTHTVERYLAHNVELHATDVQRTTARHSHRGITSHTPRHCSITSRNDTSLKHNKLKRHVTAVRFPGGWNHVTKSRDWGANTFFFF